MQASRGSDGVVFGGIAIAIIAVLAAVGFVVYRSRRGHMNDKLAPV